MCGGSGVGWNYVCIGWRAGVGGGIIYCVCETCKLRPACASKNIARLQVVFSKALFFYSYFLLGKYCELPSREYCYILYCYCSAEKF